MNLVRDYSVESYNKTITIITCNNAVKDQLLYTGTADQTLIVRNYVFHTLLTELKSMKITVMSLLWSSYYLRVHYSQLPTTYPTFL